MLQQNHYLTLFKTRSKPNDVNLLITEIAYMHNALGQVIKQMIGYFARTQSKGIQKFTQKVEETQSVKSQRSQQHKKFQQKKLIVKNQIKKQHVEDIDDSSSQNRKEMSFDRMDQEIEVFRSKPISKPNLNQFLKIDQDQPKFEKAIYRQNMKHNSKKKQLKGVDCQQCRNFYGAVSINLGNSNKMCQHMSRHRTNAPYQKIKNFSQQFDSDL